VVPGLMLPISLRPTRGPRIDASDLSQAHSCRLSLRQALDDAEYIHDDDIEDDADDDECDQPPFVLIVESDCTKLPQEYTLAVRRAASDWVMRLTSQQLVDAQPHRRRHALELHDNEQLAATGWRVPVAALVSLLGHAPETISAANLEPAAAACALELLLAMGLAGDAQVAGRRLLHFVASGGCDPHVYDDIPQPLPPRLLHRLARLLLRCGARTEDRDAQHGATPLSWAAWFGCEAGLTSMLSLGAHRGARDRYGATSRGVARGRWNIDIDDAARCSTLCPCAESVESRRQVLDGAQAPSIVAPSAGHRGRHRDNAALARSRNACRRETASALRRLHASWAEADCRAAAAAHATYAAYACETITGKMLPGPAREAVASALMDFKLWAPVTRPRVWEE